MTVMFRVRNYLVLKVSAVKESTTCHSAVKESTTGIKSGLLLLSVDSEQCHYTHAKYS